MAVKVAINGFGRIDVLLSDSVRSKRDLRS